MLFVKNTISLKTITNLSKLFSLTLLNRLTTESVLKIFTVDISCKFERLSPPKNKHQCNINNILYKKWWSMCAFKIFVTADLKLSREIKTLYHITYVLLRFVLFLG